MPKPKATITFNREKLIEKTTCKSLSDMCRRLEIKVNDNPCIQAGRYKDVIFETLKCHADISVNQTKAGGNIQVNIIKVYDAPQGTNINTNDVAKYLRPIIQQMVSDEYAGERIVKFHSNLTVDLGYMGAGYKTLYNSVYRTSKIDCFGIENKESYAKYITKKLIDKIKGHIKSCCIRFGYDGIKAEQLPMDKETYEFLNENDTEQYFEFKELAKLEVDEEKAKRAKHNPHARGDYRNIGIVGTGWLNELRKKENPEHSDIEIFEPWTFEEDGSETFKRVNHTLFPQQVNRAILDGFLNLIGYNALREYAQTAEYKAIIEKGWINPTNASQCTDKAVRQALTVNNRDNTAKKQKINEIDIELSFPIQHIDSYVRDIDRIMEACRV